MLLQSIGVFVLLCIGCVFGDELDMDDHWEIYKDAYDKEFDNETHEDMKQDEFEKTVKAVVIHNIQADMGLHTYTKGINQFTDLTADEIKGMLGVKIPDNIEKNYMPENITTQRASYPASFDWRDYGAVGPVPDQQSCGSCWAFAVAGSLEGFWQIKTGKLENFSEQQLVDCSNVMGTSGCDGGWPDDAFKYVKKYGIERDNCYTYKNSQGKCNYQSSCMVTKISNYYDVPHSESDLQNYLYNYGPVVVVIYVNDDLMDYKSGVFKSSKCNGDINHAVLLVGYGTENNQPYWLIRNSWGPNWGQQGYFKMARNSNDMCKISSSASIPWMS